MTGPKDDNELTQLRALMLFPIEERRKILRRQAEAAAHYYEARADEWKALQGGDIVDYEPPDP